MASIMEFDNCVFIEGGVCAPSGFKAGGINGHIKPDSIKNDIGIIFCENRCVTAAVYTKNKVKGAPIAVTKKHLEDGMAQAVIVNSGNANTCNSDGEEIAEKACKITADALGISENDVIVASTGVIGQKLSIQPFEKNIPTLAGMLSEKGSDECCTAIMTTDTRKKQFAVKFDIDGTECHIGAISKGSGMICPNMATMLAFITTDVSISGEMLKKALSHMTECTYNMVSVDGDTSTNDMAVIMSSGLAENKEITSEADENYHKFEDALYAIMVNLVRETARDGEGATKLITCNVTNAPSEKTAAVIAKSVIKSSLVKAALFAADANWGRILCAIGYADTEFDITKVSVQLASKAGIVKVCENGAGVNFSEEKAHNILSEDEIDILIDLSCENSENNSAIAWGCDLTYDYVKINAEYRS